MCVPGDTKKVKVQPFVVPTLCRTLKSDKKFASVAQSAHIAYLFIKAVFELKSAIPLPQYLACQLKSSSPEILPLASLAK